MKKQTKKKYLFQINLFKFQFNACDAAANGGGFIVRGKQ